MAYFVEQAQSGVNGAITAIAQNVPAGQRQQSERVTHNIRSHIYSRMGAGEAEVKFDDKDIEAVIFAEADGVKSVVIK